jgi:hypothetical protein
MIGNRMGESIILGNLGVNYADMGEYEEARDCQQQALMISGQGNVAGETFYDTDPKSLPWQTSTTQPTIPQQPGFWALERFFGINRSIPTPSPTP